MHQDERTRMERRHMFVVNQSPEFLDILRELFQQEQYNVTTGNFVPETFEQIEALNPSLLVVDLAVGEQAGWDLLKRMENGGSQRDIPTIVVSTSPRLLDTAQENPERFGGQRFLRKPFDLDDLLKAAEELIGPA
jgi:CheY-like chemotaxis protein